LLADIPWKRFQAELKVGTVPDSFSNQAKQLSLVTAESSEE